MLLIIKPMHLQVRIRVPVPEKKIDVLLVGILIRHTFILLKDNIHGRQKTYQNNQ